MKFDELKSICEDKLGTVHLADIASELGVTPQVVSNWKARNTVPYKYVKKLKLKINKQNLGKDKLLSNNSNVLSSSKSNFDDTDISFFELISFCYKALMEHTKLFIIFPIIFSVFTALYTTFFVSPIFFSQAKVIITPSGSSGKGGIGVLASEFGFNIGTSGDLSSISIIPDIIESRKLAKQILKQKFTSNNFEEKTSLLNILSGKNLGKMSSIDSSLAIKGAVKDVLGMINVDINKKNNIFTVSCFAGEPKLVAELARTVVDEIDNFQKQFKIRKIKEKRVFIQDRIKAIKNSLNESEEILKTFRERNRNIEFSPALLLKEARLERETQVLLQMFITLKNQYELAQIDEVENSSKLAFLDEPEVPNFRISPKRKTSVAIAFLIGFIFAFFVAITIRWYRDNSEMLLGILKN